jgi:aspartate kinase
MQRLSGRVCRGLATLRAYSTASARVTKFGGTSVAGSSQIEEVMGLLRADESRKFTVVSAPGKRHDDDIKVTDLLYKCHDLSVSASAEYEAFFDDNVGARYREIASTLGASSSAELDADLEAAKGKIYDMATRGDSPDFAASRGEALCGRLVADLLGWEFVDPASGSFIQFRADGTFDGERTADAVRVVLSDLGTKSAVIPGFYGSNPANPSGVQTFSRGGSDVTGSIVAAGAMTGSTYDSVIYENWTDVNGVFSADPRQVSTARSLAFLSYTELQHMASAGANVLHADAVAPSAQAAVPINIRNTKNITHPGTLIVHDDDPRAQRGADEQVVGLTTPGDDTVVVVCTTADHTAKVAELISAETGSITVATGEAPTIKVSGTNAAAVYNAIDTAGLFVQQQD